MLFNTFSDKQSSDYFIKSNQKKTEVIERKLSKSFQVYQAVFQELAHISEYCGYQEDIQEIQDSPPVFCDIL